MLENRFLEQDTVLDKVKFVAANGTTAVAEDLTVRDYVVRASNSIDSADNGAAITLTLPNVVEAAGKIYSVTATEIANAGAGTAGTIVVTSQGDDSNFEGDFTLTATGDRVVMYSDGFSWHALVNVTT